MKLWLDEARPPPSSSWTVARTVADARVDVLHAGGELEEMSLDHDLSIAAVVEAAPSGLTFARWFVKRRWPAPKITIHSQNPVAALRMGRVFRKAGYRSTWAPYGFHVKIPLSGAAHTPRSG